jgi:hypothetical protein
VPRRYRFIAWIAPLLLLNWVLLAVVPPAPGGSSLRSLAIQVLGGTVFGQTAVAAAWAAFGPMPFNWRLPFSLGWLAMLTLANAINGWLNRGSPGDCVIVGVLLLCQWLLLQFPLWGIAIGFGVQLRHADDIESGKYPSHRQFGIRQLMLVTAVVGVLFGVGRVALPYMFEEVPLLPIVASILAFLVVEEAVMTLPLVVAVLLRRHAVVGVLLALTLIGVITACEVPLIKLLITAGSAQVQEIIAINVGTAIATLALLIIVRLNGYSLATTRSVAKT